MLPGIAGLVGRVSSLPVVTRFWTASGDIVVPEDRASARVTIIATGGGGNSSPPAGGGGGAMSRSVVAVTAGETLRAVFGRSGSSKTFDALQRGATVLVSAERGGHGSADNTGTGYPGGGGETAGGVGQVRFAGGGGGYGEGGGAAGTGGSANGAARGQGVTFVQTGDGATAQNRSGGGGDYGAGGGEYGGQGRGIIIIEWGYEE